MKKDSRKLYQTVILSHNKSPFNYEKNEQAGFMVEAYNSLCGDQYTLYLEIKDQVIEKASFHGYGCAISKASSSILTRKLEGSNMIEIQNFIEGFLSIINGEKAIEDEIPEELLALCEAKHHPGRMKCATLSWEAMEAFISKHSAPE